ncbi:MAG: serine/threonine-protein kinase [Bacteroidia bacterium]|nr:serine/threonine protein kinase [Bacteroidia bacterium]MDW8014455.1 serine/threonine-protein kinase [Bacteroidia bacterium]
MSSLIGKKLLNYRIEKLIGQGGMGEVYLGVHTEIGRKVAIKVISPHLARDPRIQERFKREALILSRLNHPNIVQLYDYWARPEEGLFLVMEYVEGISLDRYIHRVLRGPLPPKQAVEIFLQVLDAFQYAHQNGVIHRDIKPSNILIRPDNTVKVLDFGIARIVSPDATLSGEGMELTRTGTTLGTVVYMSPEQLKAKSPADIDHRADIYSLGVVLFEMLTGQEMYDRGQLSEFEILVKIASEPPPSLSELNPKIAPDFEPILRRALAKKREERFQSCQEFASELLRVLPKYALQEETSAVGNPALTQAGGSLPTAIAQPPPSVKPDKESRKWHLYGIGGILILLLGGIVFFLWMQRSRAARAAQALAIADSFVVALHRHDERLLRSLLSETLSPIYADSLLSREKAIQKYFVEFWQSLKEDSVRWEEAPQAKRYGGRVVVEGLLYQVYTPRPQLLPVEVQVPGRRPPFRRTVLREAPLPPVCKIKKLRLSFQEHRIAGIEVLDSRECPK